MSPAIGPDVVLVGGGGHASVCLDVVRSSGRRVRGYVGPLADDLDAEHLGDDAALAAMDPSQVQVLVAVGDNARRLQLIAHVRALGLELASAISAHAVVSPSATVGRGSVVMAGAIVNARSRIGDGVILNTGATVDHDCSIGDGAHVAPGCHLAGSVVVGTAAFLGVGTSVIPGIEIGAGAMVGAGAAVVADIAGATLHVGVPARFVKHLSR